MTNFAVMEGSAGLGLNEVAHVLLPGRGRNETGDDLSSSGEVRALCAAELYIGQGLEAEGGVIVASGYKTPADKAGEPWSPPDSNEIFKGVPEAYSYRRFLIRHGIGAAAVRVEPHSIDTVTNFVLSEREGHFPDERPVAIVAQERHLDRMIRRIAPKTLRRDYLGIVVPEEGDLEPDSVWAELESRAALLGVHPNTPHIIGRTTILAQGIWTIVNSANAVMGLRDQYPFNKRASA